MPPKGDFKNVPAVTHLRVRVQKHTGRTALAGDSDARQRASSAVYVGPPVLHAMHPEALACRQP